MKSLLSGKKIISTRPLNRNKDLAESIKAEGGELLYLPLIKLSASNNNDIDNLFKDLDSFSYIIFTSLFGFSFFHERLKKENNYQYLIKNIKIISIGYRTSEEIRKAGFKISFDANAKNSIEFTQKLNLYIKDIDTKILWLTGNLSANTIKENINSNIKLTRINIYNNRMPEDIDKNIISCINKDEYDLIITASPSAVSNLNTLTKVKKLRLVCIGKTTANFAINKGYSPLIIADTPTNTGLSNAILKYYKQKSSIKI